MTLNNPNGGTGPTIAPLTQLVIEPGTPNEETVTVTAVTPQIPTTSATVTANFTLPHPFTPVTGNPNGSYFVMIRGNPGAWTAYPYDPRLDPGVVLYYSIID